MQAGWRTPNFRPPEVAGVFSAVDEIRMSRKKIAVVANGW
jgi:hypothetical protein